MTPCEQRERILRLEEDVRLMQHQILETTNKTTQNTADINNVINIVKNLTTEIRVSNRTQLGVLLTIVGYLIIYWVKGGG